MYTTLSHVFRINKQKPMVFVIHSLKLRQKKLVFSLSARLLSFEMMKVFPQGLVN